jgi:hypothetical protein
MQGAKLHNVARSWPFRDHYACKWAQNQFLYRLNRSAGIAPFRFTFTQSLERTPGR